ncbi:MAG: hypothetical protein KAS32_17220 [Candidatus Peribacteraceae bacterium]|nr:hypothetical protein [Candidatus Peribacteraceae bacterium]
MSKLYVLHIGGQEIEFEISQYTFDDLSKKIEKIIKGKDSKPLKIETSDGFRYFVPKPVLDSSVIIIDPDEDTQDSPTNKKPYKAEGKVIKIDFVKGK